jgi:hypothetical protein
MGDLFRILFQLRLFITLAYFSIDHFPACFIFLSIILKHWLNCIGLIFGGSGEKVEQFGFLYSSFSPASLGGTTVCWKKSIGYPTKQK